VALRRRCQPPWPDPAPHPAAAAPPARTLTPSTPSATTTPHPQHRPQQPRTHAAPLQVPDELGARGEGGAAAPQPQALHVAQVLQLGGAGGAHVHEARVAAAALQLDDRLGGREGGGWGKEGVGRGRGRGRSGWAVGPGCRQASPRAGAAGRSQPLQRGRARLLQQRPPAPSWSPCRPWSRAAQACPPSPSWPASSGSKRSAVGSEPAGGPAASCRLRLRECRAPRQVQAGLQPSWPPPPPTVQFLALWHSSRTTCQGRSSAVSQRLASAWRVAGGGGAGEAARQRQKQRQQRQHQRQLHARPTR
jgi:hypothetical protein